MSSEGAQKHGNAPDDHAPNDRSSDFVSRCTRGSAHEGPQHGAAEQTDCCASPGLAQLLAADINARNAREWDAILETTGALDDE
jgi:hypothetical protein